MKVVILAGGFGTRISEESHLKPKPMIEIGGMPILWHIMKIYLSHGFNEFIICCGYKQSIIKEFFSHYYLHNSDITFKFDEGNPMHTHSKTIEKWSITLVDTGINTMTGGRLKRVQKYIGDEAFMMTYGDGVSDVDLEALVNFHKSTGKIATITAVKPEPRFGILDLDGSSVRSFREKSVVDITDYINGGFMVFEPAVFGYIDGDETVLEREPLAELASDNQLSAFKHDGFWQCMDSQRDRSKLEEIWRDGNASWKRWR